MSDPLVLAYHAVSPSWEWHYSVRPEQLERQLSWLLDHGYRAVPFSRAFDENGKRFAVTFDDGFRSAVENGKPILDRLGVPATVFVVTDYLDGVLDFRPIDRFRGTRDEPELEGITWDDLQSLVASGWEVGSHTRTHPPLTTLDDAALDDELVGSRRACEERLSATCDLLAYPFGAHDSRVVAAAARAGYRLAAAFPPHFPRGDRMRVARVGLERLDDGVRFRLQASPVVARLRGSPAWDAVRAVRRLL